MSLRLASTKNKEKNPTNRCFYQETSIGRIFYLIVIIIVVIVFVIITIFILTL